MKSHVRTAVAAIALSHASGKRVSFIYVFSGGGYVNIDMSVVGNKVVGYDYSTGSHIGGTLPNLYHYGEGSFIEFKVGTSKYKGYDYGSSSHFDISVSGKIAELYDYGAGGFFSYST